MISAWWLLVIIPAIWFGIFIAGLLHCAKGDDAPKVIKSVRDGSAGL